MYVTLKQHTYSAKYSNKHPKTRHKKKSLDKEAHGCQIGWCIVER